MSQAGANAAAESRAHARPSPLTTEQIVEIEFRDFVQQPDFPCLGAKSVVRVNRFTLRVYGALGNDTSARALAFDLCRFSEGAGDVGLSAFVAVFPHSAPKSEIDFERRLWAQLQRLHDADPERSGWAKGVSSDPDDGHFSFSVGGHAFFVVGLHRLSSRLARRFRWPALVFNPHEQFSRLREQGRFDSLRSAIRARDLALQGTENPNLADFGERSEARQYSGRPTEADWKCPFRRRPP